MYPLIEIKTVPIELQMKVTPAHLEYSRGTAQVEIRRDQGGLSIRSQPIQVNIDTFEARNSVVPTTMRSIEQQAQRGNQSVYEATATIAREGKMMMEAKPGEDVIPQLARQQTLGQLSQVNISFIPTTGADISWSGGDIQVQYQMDELNFDWNMQDMSFTFVPGDIEISVTQQPDVIIKYVGGPLYVPPSSDPNYEPLDVKA